MVDTFPPSAFGAGFAAIRDLAIGGCLASAGTAGLAPSQLAAGTKSQKTFLNLSNMFESPAEKSSKSPPPFSAATAATSSRTLMTCRRSASARTLVTGNPAGISAIQARKITISFPNSAGHSQSWSTTSAGRRRRTYTIAPSQKLSADCPAARSLSMTALPLS